MPKRHETTHGIARTSRRALLRSGAGVLAGSIAAQTLSSAASAQDAGDAVLVRLQGARRILIKGGVLLTLDAQVGDFAKGDMLIEDGKIREIGAEIAASGDAAVVDGANRIVIPGFVDTHNHSYQGLMRSIMPNGVLEPDYNRDVQAKLSPAFAPPEVHAGVLMTAIAMIDMGITTIVDLSQISHTPEHSDACVHALQESGIRAVFAYSRGNPATMQYPQDIARLARSYFSSKDQLLTLALGAGLDAKIFAAAREAGVSAVLHLVAPNTSPTFMELGRAGLLRPGDEYIHCLNLTDDAWKLIKDSGGNVSQCPQIDMAMGHGTPSIQEALDRGLRPSLSSDHPVTIAQDFFTVMRHTFTFQRSQIFARARAGERNLPALMTCRDALEFATIAGARCANLDRKIGTLTPGKEADVVLLRADDPTVWPVNNAPGTVVNMMNPGHIDAVFIAGKVRKWHGKLIGVDMARVMHLATEARDSLWHRAGYTVDFMA
ncbi:MAG TPA: amidohydrolase family protein [Xanthobacteraceae bacterium]|nr:amidohydrolase family protein [Xanthobacteraceae bacterium]